jgi:cation-transporting ATPase 13A3/4/5
MECKFTSCGLEFSFVRVSHGAVISLHRFVVATALPPLLPTVFTVSVGISESRLADRRITCTNNESILVAGKVKTAFFDKTGTLTNQGLDFISARSSLTWNSDDSEKISDEMARGMATCQGLTMSMAGELIGSPIDKSMFNATGATFSSKEGVLALSGDFGEVEILKRFDFDHHRMTQSVIVKTGDGRMIAFVKGSGESIMKICQPYSLPNDFDTVLRGSAKSGIYQISMASKEMSSVDLSKISRDEIEQNLSFVGVINFKNVLRDETPATIRELQDGEVRLLMITGDSLLTGICIARECKMIQPNKSVLLGSKVDASGVITWINESDEEVSLPSLDSLRESEIELAMTGEIWNALRMGSPKEVTGLAEYIRVVGRCTPFDKVSVISAFIELGHVTLMCGDGGNDCGALKTAHVGIALSDAEASIVSPFTSLDKSIHSVVEVLREGRCALASAFASYKFMIMYGQVGTINQLINAYFQVTFAEWCWVFLDGVWPITLAFALPLARAAKKLSLTRPTASLLGPATMFSACGVLAINFIFIVIALFTLFGQSWFQCRKWGSTDVSNTSVIGDNYESETIFLVTGFQYISSAIVFNFGYEWRQAWIRNYIFAGLVFAYTFMQLWITLVPGKLSCFWRVNCNNDDVVRGVASPELVPILNPFNTTMMPQDFRNKLIAIMVCNTVAVIAWDFFVVNGIRRRLAAKKRGVKEMGELSRKHEGNNDTDNDDTDKVGSDAAGIQGEETEEEEIDV